MLVTTIPAALNQNSGLIYNARAERLVFDGNKVIGVEVTALNGDYQPSGTTFTVTGMVVTSIDCLALVGQPVPQ